MHDVAARAGVSHQTVSRALNDPAAVTPATRARVSDAIGQLGYRSNLAARTLATRRSKAIGILAPSTSDHGPTSAVHALEFAARARGYRPVVVTRLESEASVSESLSLLLQQSVEGVALVAPNATTAGVTSSVAGCPVVSVQGSEDPDAVTAIIDQAMGVELAIQHLLALGHRRIEMIAGPPHYPEALQRTAAFHLVTRRAGLVLPPPLPGDWSARSGHHAADLLAPDSTAVFCANDQMALGLICALNARGIRVPQDVSIVGFDDIPEAEFFSPPLTTVRQDFARVGELAIEQLLQLIDGDPPRDAAISPQLIVRASTHRLA